MRKDRFGAATIDWDRKRTDKQARNRFKDLGRTNSPV